MAAQTVEDVMIHQVITVSPNMTIEEVKQKLIESNFHGFPVAENGYLLGYVTAKELLTFMDEPKAILRTKMSRGTLCVIPSMSIDDAVRVMFRYGIRNLPVVDENKRLIGIVSNIDIVRSQIEKTGPAKVMSVKKLLEDTTGVRMKVYNAVVPLDQLIPTQAEIFQDELFGRISETKRGWKEQILVVRRRYGYIIVDGHHRAMAAKQLGMKEYECVVLEPNDMDVPIGLETTAKKWGLHSLDDIKIIEGSKHPFMEIATMLMPDEIAANINKKLLERMDANSDPGVPDVISVPKNRQKQ